MTNCKGNFFTTTNTTINSRIRCILAWMMNPIKSIVSAFCKKFGVFVECHLSILLKNSASREAPNG